MAVFLACSGCGSKLKAPDTVGRKLKCPRCGKVLTVPTRGADQDDQESEDRSEPPVPKTADAPQVGVEPATASERSEARPSPDFKNCPFCGETILAVAVKCKHCGEMLDVSRALRSNLMFASGALRGAVNALLSRKRLISPGALGLALLFFCLPWLEVSCEGHTILTQSGLQAAYGGYSLSSEFRTEAATQSRNMNESPRWAPLVVVFGLLISIGAVVGLLICFRKRRSNGPPFHPSPILAEVCAVAAFALLTLQFFVGFPIENELGADRLQRRSSGQRAALEELDASMLKLINVRYTIWLWMAYVTTAIPGGLLALEKFQQRVGRPSRNSNRTVPNLDRAEVPSPGPSTEVPVATGDSTKWLVKYTEKNGDIVKRELTIAETRALVASPTFDSGMQAYHKGAYRSVGEIKEFADAFAARTSKGKLTSALTSSPAAIVFGIALSAIAGAVGDFLRPIAPINAILCLSSAGLALLALVSYAAFFRRALMLASLVLFSLAAGCGIWWGLAESKGSHGLGFSAHHFGTVAEYQRSRLPNVVDDAENDAKGPGTATRRVDSPSPLLTVLASCPQEKWPSDWTDSLQYGNVLEWVNSTQIIGRRARWIVRSADVSVNLDQVRRGVRYEASIKGRGPKVDLFGEQWQIHVVEAQKPGTFDQPRFQFHLLPTGYSICRFRLAALDHEAATRLRDMRGHDISVAFTIKSVELKHDALGGPWITVNATNFAIIGPSSDAEDDATADPSDHL